MNQTVRLLASLAGVIFLPGIAYSAAYDAVADFNSTGVQPSEATWIYGSESSFGGAFAFTPHFGTVVCGSASTLPSNCEPVGATMLTYFATSIEASGGETLLYNASGTTITYTKGATGVDNNVVFPADVLGMSPGGGLQVARWIAPIAGTFDVGGFYQDLQRASVSLYIQVAGVTKFNSSFSGASTLQGQIPFSLGDLALAAGDTVDFVIDSQGDSDDDIVGLSAKVVSAVPEPNILAAFFAGLLGIIWMRGRRRVLQIKCL